MVEEAHMSTENRDLWQDLQKAFDQFNRAIFCLDGNLGPECDPPEHPGAILRRTESAVHQAYQEWQRFKQTFKSYSEHLGQAERR
jgi:hypothetical protein